MTQDFERCSNNFFPTQLMMETNWTPVAGVQRELPIAQQREDAKSIIATFQALVAHSTLVTQDFG